MEYLLTPRLIFEDQVIKDLCTSGVGRRKAEDQLFQTYFYLIRVGETKYTLRREDLFDAYSDTILAIIHSITHGCFKNRSSLKTFVCEIFHNKCVDLIRKRAARKNIVYKTESISDLESCLSDNSMSIIDKLIKQSDVENIKQKLNYLSEKNQQVLLLSADGYTDRQIAEMTKFKTADVVKTCRLRSLKRLRQQVP